jgi:16S rRNA (adenine1518-N6/adenine1519-N6)-dimethyltransferase
MDRREINSVLTGAGLRPQHRFGQNFMVDQVTLARIADAGEVAINDVVLEVGPGVGNLTRLLAQRAAAVLAVDIDAPLLHAARRHHQELKNITWLQQDILAGKHQISSAVVDELRRLHAMHPTGNIKLVSNLPYNVASPLIAELLVLMWHERRTPAGIAFERMAFTVQWEVAQRMAARIDTRDYGPLGILIGLLADVEIMRKIPPGAFWPPPKIHSALVKVRPRPDRFDAVADVLGLQKMLTGVFGHRRQRVSNALHHWLKADEPPDLIARLQAAGIDATARPEQLTPQQFVTLAEICRR